MSWPSKTTSRLCTRVVAHHFTAGAEDVTGLAQDCSTSISKDHGRLEVRRCWAIGDPAVLEWLDPERTWPGLSSIACIEDERRIDGQITRAALLPVQSAGRGGTPCRGRAGALGH